MLYAIAKVIMWTTLHFYFRRIMFVGKRNIPDGEPVILIANHSASFLDAMLLAVLMRRPLYFFARSDIFRKDWANRILRSFHMIPIYNIEHGKSNLVRNEETFGEGEQVLSDKGLLLIFPEGTSRIERIMLPLKKGTARVALQTESRKDFKLGLSVIPVGINYSAHRFRADVHLEVGKATRVDEYENVYRDNPARAITLLTRELETKFAETIIFVKQPERTTLINRLLEFFRNDNPHHPGDPAEVPMMVLEKKVCDTVSGLTDEEASGLSDTLKRYDELLIRSGVRDRSVNGRYHLAVLHFLLLTVTFPFFIVGALFSSIPLFFGKWVADRSVTRIDFYTSVITAAGGFSWVIWWVLHLVLAAFIGNPWYRIIVITAPITLFMGIYWWEAFYSFASHLRYLWLKRTDREMVLELAALRSRLRIWQKRQP